LGDEPEIIEGDIISRDAVVRTLNGARAIIIAISALTWNSVKQIRQIERDAVLMILDEAQKTGISRVVYLSGYEMRKAFLIQHNMLEFGEIKLEIEATLAQSDFNWTILGEAPSMELFFAFLRNGKMTVPGGGPPAVPTISRDDVGKIAAQTILRNDLSGQRFRVTGPEALSFPEAAARISKITGQPVKFIKIPVLPIRIISMIIKPFNPYLRYIYWSLTLLNNFPPDLAEQVPADHQRLRETFAYKPTTFDMEIQKRFHL
jgi:uncharacterized protein YbjT (DUF2867 family)